MLDIREQFEPDYLAVVFDAGDSFRDVEYPDYKATREKMPDDLADSLGRVRDIVAGFNDRVVELDGYEADDVIGTLALMWLVGFSINSMTLLALVLATSNMK